ncbi:MAG: AraC family transcriptional regulator [Collimonas sp.]|uniref:AraC family transcriptional regulator n=1 Tax=Collimonas sp. TaxID=1963772 RepID=UPI003265A793
MTTMVRTGVLTGYFEVARQIGFNPRAVLQKFGLTRTLLENRDQQILLSKAVGILEGTAQESGNMGFGLQMAELRQLADMGGVSLVLAHQRNLRDALQTTIQYRHLLNPSLALFVENAGDTVIIREEIVTDIPVPTRQATELAIGVMFRLCGTLAGAQWHPRSVNFTHDAPTDLQLHRRFFRCPVVFGSEFNGIVCNASDLDLANPMADPAMASYAQRFLETMPRASEPSILMEVRKAIYLLLPMERATIEQIAQALGMNVRTMQRRLEDAGENFSALINGVRRDLVVRYMENPRYSVGRIAALLGYGAPSSFTRWFISQFGVAPAVWRVKKGLATGNRFKQPH